MEAKISAATVIRYGSIRRSWLGMPEPSACRRTCNAEAKPKSSAPHIAFPGMNRAKITTDTAIYKIIEAANMDMTEFFDAWGFFIPVSFKLYAYGSFSYTVTQDMINQTLAYMKTFSTKCPPIEYIEDRRYQVGAKGNQKGISEDGGDVGYFETFQNKVKITKTVSYTVSGRTYTVTNGEQAVAFELIKDGKKVWFANRFVFTVPAEADIEGAELYAVQADGQRIKANK